MTFSEAKKEKKLNDYNFFLIQQQYVNKVVLEACPKIYTNLALKNMCFQIIFYKNYLLVFQVYSVLFTNHPITLKIYTFTEIIIENVFKEKIFIY